MELNPKYVMKFVRTSSAIPQLVLSIGIAQRKCSNSVCSGVRSKRGGYNIAEG
jgi:hypothetical protein